MKFFTFATLFVVLICVLYFARSDGGSEIFERSSEQSGRPPAFMKNIELYEYLGDEIQWRLKAIEAYAHEDENLILVKKPEVETRLNNSNKDSIFVRADWGEIRGKSGTAVVRGNARVEFAGKSELFAQRLFIDRKKGIIYNRGDVKIVSGKDTVKARSMLYNLKTGLLTLRNPHAEIVLD